MVAIHRPALTTPGLLRRHVSMRRLLIVAAAVAVAVALVQVNQLGRVTSTGYEIDALSRERAAKQAENLELEGDVANYSSLAHIDIDARLRLHLVPAARRLYLPIDHAPPERDSLPTRYLPAARPTQSQPPSRAPWWKRALDHVPFL